MFVQSDNALIGLVPISVERTSPAVCGTSCTISAIRRRKTHDRITRSAACRAGFVVGEQVNRISARSRAASNKPLPRVLRFGPTGLGHIGAHKPDGYRANRFPLRSAHCCRRLQQRRRGTPHEWRSAAAEWLRKPVAATPRPRYGGEFVVARLAGNVCRPSGRHRGRPVSPGLRHESRMNPGAATGFGAGPRAEALFCQGSGRGPAAAPGAACARG